jgi:hypothetical protein
MWYLAQLYVSDDARGPGTQDYDGEMKPVNQVYPDGRIWKVVGDRLGDGLCLCNWEGTPPTDWEPLTMEQAKEQFKNRVGGVL